jgi:GxxExxY protein
MSNTLAHDFKHKALTDKIIRVFYNVYNTLGNGFLERCYEQAMLMKLECLRLQATAQVPLAVFYKNIGQFYADIIVENTVILELKAVSELTKEHSAQLLNYIRATEIEVGLLLNFGAEAQVVRKTIDNSLKKSIHTSLTS